MQLSKASVGPPTSAIAALGDGGLFLASWLGDSLLVRAIKQQPKVCASAFVEPFPFLALGALLVPHRSCACG